MPDLVSVQVKGNVGTIEDNLDLVENSIREKAQEYAAVAVTEDTIKDGKKFLANIRKEQKALDDERMAVKARWMAPYEAFEKRAKQIIALYDEPIKIINRQLDEFERKRRSEKRQEIEAIYNLVKGEMGEWLPLKRIFNQRWENATYSGKKIQEDMELAFDQMRISITTIKSMNSELETDALRVLKETGSLQGAIAEINELQKQKERFVEQARREAERKQQEKERLERERAEKDALLQGMEERAATNETPGEADGSSPRPAVKEPDAELPFALEKILTVTVKVGENNFNLLKDFLETAGLEYEVV